MAEWYIDRYNTMNVFIECPNCKKGFRGNVFDAIPDKCPACGSENKGGGRLNIKEGSTKCEE